MHGEWFLDLGKKKCCTIPDTSCTIPFGNRECADMADGTIWPGRTEVAFDQKMIEGDCLDVMGSEIAEDSMEGETARREMSETSSRVSLERTHAATGGNQMRPPRAHRQRDSIEAHPRSDLVAFETNDGTTDAPMYQRPFTDSARNEGFSAEFEPEERAERSARREWKGGSPERLRDPPKPLI